MVVTRRTPNLSAAPMSRSQSSQNLPQPARPSISQEPTNLPRPSSPLASEPTPTVAEAVNGANTSSAPLIEKPPQELEIPAKKKHKHKPAKNKHRKRKSNFRAALDFFSKLLLLAITIYTLSVCPQDAQLQSPICRGLTEYRRIVLDPYVLPPFQAFIAHPYIAPSVERTKPYLYRSIEATAPVLSLVQTQWNLHVAPRWEKHVLAEWNKRVVPRWHEHVTPRIETFRDTVEPYGRRARLAYDQHVAPPARYAIHRLQWWQQRAQPYVLLAVSKTQEGCRVARPYTAPLIRRSGLAIRQLALFLQEQRQKFVDPHVAKIWDKVKELSRRKQDDGGEPGYLSEAASSEPAPSDAGEDALAPPVDVITPSESELPYTRGFTEHPTHSMTAGSPTLTEAPLTPSAEESLPDAESTPVETPPSPRPRRPSETGSLAAEEKASVAASASATPDHFELPPPEGSTRSSLAGGDGTDEMDMNAFYAEIGLDDDFRKGLFVTQDHAHDLSGVSAEAEEDEAERARLKGEETALRRAEIDARHSKWETELRAQMERSSRELQGRLDELRESAAAELSSSAHIRDAMEELASEAEKYIKGTEIYLKNLKGENGKREETVALWDRVVDKVGERFVERLDRTRGVVDGLFGLVLAQEMQEVNAAVSKVREVAEKAQVDLGFDYAWLEDVRYDDWQRYHRLIEASDEYAEEAASLQSGTHAMITVENPLVPVVKDVESELQDIVVGFETRLRRIKRDGLRSFQNGNGGASSSSSSPSSSSSSSSCDKVGSGTEPEMSILPIPSAGTDDKAHGYEPLVIIGRSGEEVSDAIKRAGSAAMVVEGGGRRARRDGEERSMEEEVPQL